MAVYRVTTYISDEFECWCECECEDPEGPCTCLYMELCECKSEGLENQEAALKIAKTLLVYGDKHHDIGFYDTTVEQVD